MKQTRSRTVTLRMTPEDNETIEEAARLSYRTKSEMIVYATMQYLDLMENNRNEPSFEFFKPVAEWQD